MEEQAPTEDTRSSIQKKEQAALGSLNTGAGEAVIDASQAKAALQSLSTQSKQLTKEEEERRKALASVKVSAEDVELIVSEFEVSKAVADRVLRENGGDVVVALRAFVKA
jgi:NACalpha-BTF3-like transcription factor